MTDQALLRHNALAVWRKGSPSDRNPPPEPHPHNERFSAERSARPGLDMRWATVRKADRASRD